MGHGSQTDILLGSKLGDDSRHHTRRERICLGRIERENKRKCLELRRRAIDERGRRVSLERENPPHKRKLQQRRHSRSHCSAGLRERLRDLVRWTWRRARGEAERREWGKAWFD